MGDENMFDKLSLKEALTGYKRDFIEKIWPKEKYKWEAVKKFQESWDINSYDFSQMLAEAFSKTGNLLKFVNHLPAKMIIKFAEINSEEVRSMFIGLFDERDDIYERIDSFKIKSDLLLECYGNGAARHYQDENAISTYLWLRYPDKYYIYKFNEIKALSDKLKSDYRFKKGLYTDNIRNFILFYDEICEELVNDDELINLFRERVTEDCYPDEKLHILTVDVAFYISRYFGLHTTESMDERWWPVDYSPKLTVEDWTELLINPIVFTESGLEIMARIKDYGGKATCEQLSIKYGRTKEFYENGSLALAKRVANMTECPVFTVDDYNVIWWPILYVGKSIDNNGESLYLWKLRDELSNALDEVDFSDIQLYAESDTNGNESNYWWLNANPRIWSFSNIDIGETESYTLFNNNGNKRRVFKNFLDVKKGDMIIGYESYPVKQVVAIGRVTDEQDGEKICFEKVEDLSSPIDYAVLKDCPELGNMEYFTNQQGSLFKLSKNEYDFIVGLICEKNAIFSSIDADKKYTKKEFLEEVYMSEAKYDRLVSVLKRKKNIILQGAPGVGKTFAAKRLCYSIMGVKDDNRIEFVQFHQNYSYEDFVIGYKPVREGFELRYGVFYHFCKKASENPDKDYFFIIDEINRGNMSKIFGELLMLIESDYRGKSAKLAYNGVNFSVPERLHIIGMMNTADRSLAMIDYALRRRFSFFDMGPGFDSEGFLKYQESFDNDTFDRLISEIKNLNKEIANDKYLGSGFCIGHSYFCGAEECTDEWMREVVDYDILPMINEYWFDDNDKRLYWDNILRGVFQ